MTALQERDKASNSTAGKRQSSLQHCRKRFVRHAVSFKRLGNTDTKSRSCSTRQHELDDAGRSYTDTNVRFTHVHTCSRCRGNHPYNDIRTPPACCCSRRGRGKCDDACRTHQCLNNIQPSCTQNMRDWCHCTLVCTTVNLVKLLSNYCSEQTA